MARGPSGAGQRRGTSSIDVTITSGDRTFEVGVGSPVTFGRSRECVLCLDADDVGISRRAGSVEEEAGTIWLVNRSTNRPLTVRDELGLRSVVLPGRRIALEAPVTVIVEGSLRQHVLHVEVPRPATADEAAEVPEGMRTVAGEAVVIREDDRLALVALFAGYLEDPPRYKPYPRTYEAAAKRLGWPRTKLIKRIEYLRRRLDDAGVPNLLGYNALEQLAEHVIATRVITKQDLELLRR
jgi:hypothetical protein